MDLRAVTFDYGGTLDGPASHWLDRFVALYAAAAAPCPAAAIRDAFYAADAALEGDPAVRELSLAALLERHVDHQLRHLGLGRPPALRAHLVEGFLRQSEAALAASARTLARLAPRYRLGVVSNFYGNLERILTDAGLRHFFRFVADSGRLGVRKPDRAIFERTLAALEVPPESAAHVGDSYERDVLAAGALGCRTVWLVADAGRRAPGRADACLATLEAVPAWLERTAEGGGGEAGRP